MKSTSRSDQKMVNTGKYFAFDIHKLAMIVKLAILFSISLNNILQMVVSFFFLKKKGQVNQRLEFSLEKNCS